MISLDRVQRSYNFSSKPLVESKPIPTASAHTPKTLASRFNDTMNGQRRTYDPRSRNFSCWNCNGPHPFVDCHLPLKEFCRYCGCQGVNSNNCTRCKKN